MSVHDMIFVWKHEDAPSSLRELGEGEWIATIPPAMAGETVSLFNSSQFDSYPHPFLHGWEVRIGMSTPHET
jgi:hypothetical protein